jgi:peptidyl-dipeptidase Dcp
MRSVILQAALCAYPLFALAQVNATADSNPFFKEWNTPFGVPPFNEIKDEHFLPALKKGIDEQRREVQAIAANAKPATFANTIEALDGAGELLDKVQSVFST